jgi:hypothetical protein
VNWVVIAFAIFPDGTVSRGPWRRRAMETSQYIYSAVEIRDLFSGSTLRPLELALVSQQPSSEAKLEEVRVAVRLAVMILTMA